MNTALEDKLAQKCETKTTSINKERPRLAKLSEKKINEFLKEILKKQKHQYQIFSRFCRRKNIQKCIYHSYKSSRTSY